MFIYKVDTNKNGHAKYGYVIAESYLAVADILKDAGYDNSKYIDIDPLRADFIEIQNGGK
jgi:hypothetical protein